MKRGGRVHSALDLLGYASLRTHPQAPQLFSVFHASHRDAIHNLYFRNINTVSTHLRSSTLTEST